MTRDIVAEHPSRGPFGSVFQTQDQQVYVRTPWGLRKVEAAVGQSLVAAQAKNDLLHSLRRRLIFVTGLSAFAVGLVVGILVA
jgi:hypothetical protein